MTDNPIRDDRQASLLVRAMAMQCVRNTALEDIHAGDGPVSRTGDWSDVTVVDAEGRRIPWPQVSHFGDDDMRALMREIVDNLYTFLVPSREPGFMDRIGIWMKSASRADRGELLARSHRRNELHGRATVRRQCLPFCLRAPSRADGGRVLRHAHFPEGPGPPLSRGQAGPGQLDDKAALLETLGADFLSLLDAVTIARSRWHIRRYYPEVIESIGDFPERAPPLNLFPATNSQGELSYEELHRRIGAFRLALYMPSQYLTPRRA